MRRTQLVGSGLLATWWLIVALIKLSYRPHSSKLIVWIFLFIKNKINIFLNAKVSQNYDVEAIDYWTIFSMKTKWNQNWKLYWNLGVFLMLLESIQRATFNRVYFTIPRAKVWEILIFEQILLIELQTNCKNCKMEGKILSPQCVHTWANSTGDTKCLKSSTTSQGK